MYQGYIVYKQVLKQVVYESSELDIVFYDLASQ